MEVKNDKIPSKRYQYDKEDLIKAVESIENGQSVKAAADSFHVPRTTLRNALLHNHTGKIGRQTVLSVEEEKEIAQWIVDCAKMGDPKMKFEVLDAAAEVLALHENPKREFINNKPTNSWFTGFLKRNPEISLRKPESITKASSLVSQANIEKFFDSVFSWLEENMNSIELEDLLNDPTRWLNADESGFELNPTPAKVCARRGEKHVQRIQNGKPKTQITVTYCFSADGHMFEPVILFPDSCSKMQEVAFALGSK